jgi:predicted nucleic acid-binding protein
MNGYLLDTNIVTAHLKRHPAVRQHIREAKLAGHPVRLNAVSYYETKRGLLAIGHTGNSPPSNACGACWALS